MKLPDDYFERVYAGVLGKIIGVYLGRPFENWSYERILRVFGEIQYYVHEKLNKPLILPDDDISGTFTFIRALSDHGNSADISSEQIGQTWLNYLIEHKTILWWGGRGNSTEHSVFLNLKNNIIPPESGSRAQNGLVASEQIGAQIFIDGWGMVSPGDPELAADLALRAARVSHDGEAIYASQLLAAMEALAFVETDYQQILDIGLSMIPSTSIIYRMVNELQDWHAAESDWHKTRVRIGQKYGYDRYIGNCHIVPNHALIHLALLYGDGNFQKSLMIVNTSGWDTDCNSGNVGCLLGIKNGLAGIENGPDWRKPIADRMYISSADGGRAITNAVSEAYAIGNIGRSLRGLPPILPKSGARFHFELPGSLMGFHTDDSLESRGVISIKNTPGHSLEGKRSLSLEFTQLAPGRVGRVMTATFIPQDAIHLQGPYSLQACPTLYAGQRIQARITTDTNNKDEVICNLFIHSYTPDDKFLITRGPTISIKPGGEHVFDWIVPNLEGSPIAEVGLEVRSTKRADGKLFLDYLTWEGCPDVIFTRPPEGGELWRRSWVNGMDFFVPWGWSSDAFRLVQNIGRGLLIQGTREWTDYEVEAEFKPLFMKSAGLAVRVQGMNRYYALMIGRDQKIRLTRVFHDEQILCEKKIKWDNYHSKKLKLQIDKSRLRGWVDGELYFDYTDDNPILCDGGIAIVCEEGCVSCGPVQVHSCS